MIKKLDWYILKKLIVTFLFVVIGLVVIICVIDFTEKNDDFMKNEVPGNLIFRYYMTFFPFFAVLLTPITSFIATVFVTAKLASNTEIVAILASGISFRRLMVPYLMAATLIAGMSFYLNGFVLPDANKFRITFELDYIEKPFYYNDNDIHIKIGQTDYIYIDRYNNQRDIGYIVTLEKIENNQLVEKITAKRMQYDTATEKWQFFQWQKRQILDDTEIITEAERRETLDTTLALSPADFKNSERRQETLTFPELYDYIELQKSRGADDVQVYVIEKYIRYMQPFAVIILCLIALIVSARKNRRGTGFQIAIGFFIAFVFIIFFILAKAIAEAGSIQPPFLAVWIPNIVFTIVGVFMYRTVPR
ncbi:LptF/LptG family permease [Marinoscillum sp. MHG1-6]|uniref:LptF/LptG family permease n=1 Tax=Marinoscillum sp. MHG1-6 TaxID=2959627 RepID=UPI0021573DE0|nr:LptF/LptG family permease [Marinoscillum sp. MHG1-6]